MVLTRKKIFLELKKITSEELTRRCLNKIAQCLKFHEHNEKSEKFYKIANNIKPSWIKNKSKNKPLALTQEEINFLNEKILDNQDHKDKFYIFNFWINTGCRPSSALAVRSKDVDFQKKEIYFRGSFQKNVFIERSKNNNLYSIPLSEKLEKILKDYFNQNNFKKDELIFPFSQDIQSYSKFFKFLSKTLDKKITAYNCRDTFISNQIINQIPIAVIAKWCDTSVSEIEKKYFDITINKFRPK